MAGAGNLTSSLTISLIDELSAPAQKVAKELLKIEQEAKAMAKVMANAGATDRLTAKLKTIGASAKDIEAAAAAWRDFAKAQGLAASQKDWTKQQASAARAFERQLTSSLQNIQREERATARAAEQAAVAMARAQERAASQADAARQRAHDREMARLRQETTARERELQRERREASAWSRHGALGMAAGAAAGVVSAHGVVSGIEHTVLAGARYQHEVTALQNAGRSPHDMEEIEAASKRTTAAVPTATYAENLKVINETTGAFGDLHHAIENLTFMQKTASVLHASAGDKIQGDAGELGNRFAKFFEMRGTAGNTEKFQQEANEMVRAMVFTRGNFNPQEMFNFAQQAKDALQNYSLRFMSKIAPSLVSEIGGERAGTQANAFNTVLMGRVNDNKQTEEWLKYGLLDKKQVMMKSGHAVSWRAGAVKGTDMALQDPLMWAEQVLLPAMKAKGVNVDDKLELSKALGTMFRNSNSRAFINELAQLQNRQRLHKDEANIGQVKSPDEIYNSNLQTDPTVGVKALTASLENLMTTVSGPAMTAASSALTGIAGGLNAVANAAKDHPLLALAGGTAAAGGALAGAGYLSYKLMTGFGLSTSAAALDGSAAALTEAAVALGAKGALPTALTTGGAAGGAALAAGEVAAGATAAEAGAGVAAAVAEGIGTAASVAAKGVYLPIFAALGLQAILGIKPDENDAGDRAAAVGDIGARLRGKRAPGGAGERADEVKQKATEAKGALDGLNTNATPTIDVAQIDAALAKVRELQAGLNALRSGVHVPIHVDQPNLAGILGRAQRGSFSTGGVRGD